MLNKPRAGMGCRDDYVLAAASEANECSEGMGHLRGHLLINATADVPRIWTTC